MTVGDWPDRFPVSVNDTYGAPFLIEQVPNTTDKVRALTDHRAPIALFTKAPFNPTCRTRALPHDGRLRARVRVRLPLEEH
ncbi:hypothetical protein [Nocardiopsis eucommiae]|uniref:hypothetical protein n=1 Tax=Nocardiopsis eucommiae TaxID=2831970 RepID=UPI003D703726